MYTMFNNILNYWYAQEFFSPCWTIKKEDCDLTKKDLPWTIPQTDPKIRLSFDVYFGKLLVSDLTEWLLSELKLSTENEIIENDKSVTCLFAIKIDENGKYVSDSFTLSSLIWAVCKLVSAKSLNHELSYRELDGLQQRINGELLEKQEEDENFEISVDFLYELYCYVCDQIQLPIEKCPYAVWSRCKKDYANKDDTFSPLNPATELMQSFYLKDLEKVQAAPTGSIRRYVTGMINADAHDKRIHIDCDISQMQHWLEADAFPLGAWPSTYSPSLMQQLGINLAISDNQRVFSVNGPPGTGKTTLLKEIVVSNVVKRAIILAGYKCPSDAFQKKDFQNPIDIYNKTFYQMDRKLSAFGMLVASNNNAAVENISIELPKSIKEDRTGHFSSANADDSDNTYFADIASKLLDEPAWGLISARLGKKRNLSELKERLWWSKEDDITLKSYYDSNSLNWPKACAAFRTALDAVMKERARIAQAQASLYDLNNAEKSLQEAQIAENNASKRYAQQQKRYESEEQTLIRLKNNQETEEKNVIHLKARIPFLKRVFQKFFKKDPIIIEWKKTMRQVEQLGVEIVQQRRKLNSLQEELLTAENDLNLSIEKTKQAKEHKGKKEKIVKSNTAYFKSNWADADFWRDILKNEKSQSSCPWTTPEYNKLREELFYQALMLHKAFILCSNEVRQNLMRLFAVWDDKITGANKNAAYGHLLNTLLLVIPVVSTTFASVQTFLDGIGVEELGVLIVDEAGQATPQSALGAMWRTRKTIIVGDPLQIEPIVTIPKELRKRFANEYNISPTYRTPEISVQMLADSVNIYGGIRKLDDNTLWLGCPLVTHRRCLDPMFSISNEIAYNNRMFLKTPPPKKETRFVLKKSVWFDCGGLEKGNKNHTVQQQIDLAEKIFEKAIVVHCELPDLYLISPFTTVAHALSETLRRIISKRFPNMEKSEIYDWIEKHCGTVHTFQGKEASEVLFILGCDAQSGIYAAQWVGKKPNIVNVAVSRAKYRIGVIGEYTLWKNIPYVQNICQNLERITDFDSVLN